jgi:hypothetical protein
MANKTISGLPIAVAMAGAEQFEIVQAGVSKRVLATGLFTTVLPALGIPSQTNDFVVPVRQSSTGAAWGVTISALMMALHGMPGGGTTGQLLIKNSNVDYDASWGNAGTVFNVGLAMPSIFTVSGSPVTNTGTLTAVLNTQAANLVFAGPGSGGAVAPTFRSLVGADLPNPSATTLGGIQSLAAVGSRWINTISTSGVPSATQPAFTDISGTALVTQGGTGLVAGASGGVPYFSTSTTLASSGVLTASALLLGGGAGAAPTALGSLGTTTTVLHGNAAGAPTFGAVVLTADVSGVLPVANGGTGISSLGAGVAGALGNAVTGSGSIVLATSPTLVTPTLGVATGTSLTLGATQGGAASRMSLASTSAVSEISVGQSTNYLSVYWNYNATPSAASAQIATASYANPLTIDASVLTLQGTSGGALKFGASTVALGGNLTTAGALTTTGAFASTFTMTGATAVTFPTSGTLLASASLGATTTVLHGNAGGLPSFGAVVLTTDVSGTLPVGNGGTGAATLTANGVLLGNGVSPLGVTVVGATGSILAGNTSAAPTFQTLSAVLDTITGATTQGAILFRGASGWTALSPSTAGRVLSTNGAGLDVAWVAVSGTGTVTSVTVGGTSITTSGTLPAVAYDAAQSLTSTQQDQARKNIGEFSGGGYANLFAAPTGANTMNITADAVALFNGSGNMFGATSVSLTLNVSTSGANGLDTGTIATGQYHYFVVYNPTTGTVAALASLSATAPTMPSGYTYKRRSGWIYYSGGITNFVQRNAKFTWAVPRTLASGTQASAAYFALATFVSPTASRVFGYAITNNNNVTIGDNSGNVILQITGVTSGQCFYSWSFMPQNTTYQMQYTSNSAGGQLSILGWEDNI